MVPQFCQVNENLQIHFQHLPLSVVEWDDGSDRMSVKMSFNVNLYVLAGMFIHSV